MSDPIDVDPSEVFRGLELGPGMRLGQLGQALAADSGVLMRQISRHVRGVVDLPGDVYRLVVRVANERTVRAHLHDCGSEVLAVVVPVSRTISAAGKAIPGGWLLQPVLLGKTFGVHDYIQDRAEALASLPDLPAQLAGEARGVHEFLAENHRRVDAATRALPAPETLRRLGEVDFWKATADEEWKLTCERIDAHYLAVTDDEAQLARELPIYRAAYVLAYHTLATVDPVSRALAKITPAGATAYGRFRGYRERFARIAARLKEAAPEVEIPEAVEEDPAPVAADSANTPPRRSTPPSRPQTGLHAPRAARLSPKGPQLGARRSLGAGVELDTAPHPPAEGDLTAVPRVDLARDALPTATIDAPPDEGPPRLARRLHLEDPGLAAVPEPAAVAVPTGARAADLPTGPMAPARSRAPRGAQPSVMTRRGGPPRVAPLPSAEAAPTPESPPTPTTTLPTPQAPDEPGAPTLRRRAAPVTQSRLPTPEVPEAATAPQAPASAETGAQTDPPWAR